MSTPDPKADMMAAAWVSFVMWAARESEILARYKAETGRSFPPAPARNGLEALIDGATGHLGSAAEHFAAWVTVRMWGVDEAPPLFQKRIAELKEAERSTSSPEPRDG